MTLPPARASGDRARVRVARTPAARRGRVDSDRAARRHAAGLGAAVPLARRLLRRATDRLAAPVARCCSASAPTSGARADRELVATQGARLPGRGRAATSPSRSSSDCSARRPAHCSQLPDARQPRAVHHVRCERTAQAVARDGVRARHQPRAHARERADDGSRDRDRRRSTRGPRGDARGPDRSPRRQAAERRAPRDERRRGARRLRARRSAHPLRLRQRALRGGGDLDRRRRRQARAVPVRCLLGRVRRLRGDDRQRLDRRRFGQGSDRSALRSSTGRGSAGAARARASIRTVRRAPARRARTRSGSVVGRPPLAFALASPRSHRSCAR